MKKIEDVQEAIEKEVFSLDDVTGVSIGEKDIKKCIKVGIKKSDPDLLKRIPKEKDGYEIVIENTGEFIAY